ncbi:hypothetical protein K501DRAFT_270225 [Backusella circina FSU 941]|nr:hypothetical protein K501DRAFT_270225 [Backusella circina FSU 941]
MRFSIVSTVLACALSVSAAAFEKRAVTAATQLCITDLVAVSNQLTTVTNGVNSYTASKGYIGALTVQSQESTLETKLSTAGTDCCKVTIVVSEEDANAVIAEIAPLTTQITTTLSTIVTKKPVFDSVALVTPLVKGDITSLHSKTVIIINCLLAVTPTDLLATAQGYANQIESAFQAAIAAYA